MQSKTSKVEMKQGEYMETGRVEKNVQRWETFQTETYETSKQQTYQTTTTIEMDDYKYQGKTL